MRLRARWFGALLGLAVLAYPWLAPSDYLLRVGNVVLVYAILALGLNFTVGWTGQVSLGHAGFWGIGAYTTAILTAKLAAWSPWGAMAVGATLAGLTGVLLGLPTLRIKGHYLALATIGFAEVVQLVFSNWRPVTGGADGISGIPLLAIGPFAFDTERREFYLLLVAVALLTVGAARIRDSGFGRAFMAVRDNELAADVAGVPTTSVKTLAFALGAAYAGLAGSLYAHLLRYVSPDVFGFEQSLLMLSMLVIGGLAAWPAPWWARSSAWRSRNSCGSSASTTWRSTRSWSSSSSSSCPRASWASHAAAAPGSAPRAGSPACCPGSSGEHGPPHAWPHQALRRAGGRVRPGPERGGG